MLILVHGWETMKWVKWRWLVVSLNESDCMVVSISGSVPNQEFCFPKATGKTGGILDSKTASETISKHFTSFLNFLGGWGGHAPRPSYLLRELPFLRPRSVHPQSKKSSYVYANYHLTQATQCYQKDSKGSCIYNLYMLVLTEKNWTSYVCYT